jgi:hypothetical protein
MFLCKAELIRTCNTFVNRACFTKITNVSLKQKSKYLIASTDNHQIIDYGLKIYALKWFRSTDSFSKVKSIIVNC